MSASPRALVTVILRTDLPAFVQAVFQTVAPGECYLPNWHIEAICHELGRCLTGHNTRLIVSLPPRAGKSIAVSVALVAWILGHDPTAKIICISYSKELAAKHSRDCRAVMQSDWYKRAFPATTLNPRKTTEDYFETTARGFRLATSTGATLTGLGGNYLIIDDALKPDEAYSPIARDKVNHWFRNTLLTRLNDKQKGVIIIVQQRLHQNDLVGDQLAHNPDLWYQLVLPAIATDNERIAIGPNRVHVREKDTVLHNARETRKTLDDLRQAMGEASFSAQYQQAPMPAEGSYVKLSWFIDVEPQNRPTRFDRIVQSWDTASKQTEFSDYSVCITLGVSHNQLYVLNVFRRQLTFPDLKRAVKQQQSLFNPTEILIEDKSSGIQLIQELHHEGLTCVRPVKPLGDKLMRLTAQTPTIEAGLVSLPKEASWREEFLNELLAFPNGRYDDQVDAFSQALEFIKIGKPLPGQGFLDWIKEQQNSTGLHT